MYYVLRDRKSQQYLAKNSGIRAGKMTFTLDVGIVQLQRNLFEMASFIRQMEEMRCNVSDLEIVSIPQEIFENAITL